MYQAEVSTPETRGAMVSITGVSDYPAFKFGSPG
jgi:hypothetical protein